MVIFKTAKDTHAFLLNQLKKGIQIGFVPTMGALHQGHIALISAAKRHCQLVVSSIFVNPTQFNDPNDFEKYPVTIEKDIYALAKAGCDVLFLPSVKEMYPEGLERTTTYALGYLDTVLDAAYRPGHFQGVCQVVNRLLEIVQPQQLFLGQKDYQQCLVIKRLIQITGINTSLVICPTQREASGLAMSSRNARLAKSDKEKAAKIFETLQLISKEISTGNLNAVKEKGYNNLSAAGFQPDYVEIADAATLELLEAWDGKTKLVILIAAFLGGVRLIDNLVVSNAAAG